jgi:unsaturated rhamnogalacturonyl hydrolase
LFAHFYLERTQRLYGHGWSRGQGWALLGLLDVLEHGADDLPGREQIADSLRRLASALVATQEPSGHWRGRIGDPGTVVETSAAFFFSAGIWRGVRLGVFEEELLAVADRAWYAGLESIAPDGHIAGVSAEVWPSLAESHYRGVKAGVQVPWGQGPFLLAAAERASGT